MIEGHLSEINAISNDELWVVEYQSGFADMPLPKWLQERMPDKANSESKKGRQKDIDRD